MMSAEEHALLWSDRLQDWLDGDLAGEAAQEVHDHVSGCACCRRQLEELTSLDASLRQAAPRLTLDDESFDRPLFARIDALDAARSAATRSRIEHELRESLRSLQREGRRAILFVLSGLIAGFALAFAFLAALSSSPLMQELIVLAEHATSAPPASITAVLITSISAGVGAVIARWTWRLTQ